MPLAGLVYFHIRFRMLMLWMYILHDIAQYRSSFCLFCASNGEQYMLSFGVLRLEDHNSPLGQCIPHIKLKELFEEPREPFGHLRPFLTSWIQFDSPKWLPRRPPLNTEVWLPPESHFGSSSFICDTSPWAKDWVFTTLRIVRQFWPSECA